MVTAKSENRDEGEDVETTIMTVKRSLNPFLSSYLYLKKAAESKSKSPNRSEHFHPAKSQIKSDNNKADPIIWS